MAMLRPDFGGRPQGLTRLGFLGEATWERVRRAVKHPPTLSAVLGAYKSITTLDWLNYHKKRGLVCSRHLWQRGFYDHIIRNDQDLLEKQQYILSNPLKEQEKKKNS